MKWLDSQYLMKNRVGEKRIANRFLILPLCLPNTEGKPEHRWLRWAKIRQQICKIEVYDDVWSHTEWRWCHLGWEGD